MNFKKLGSSLLGAGIGWWILGPIGMVLGLVVGSIADEMINENSQEYAEGDPKHGFVASLLVLIAAVMKSDGKVVKSELDFVKKYLLTTLGEHKSSQALILLRDILKRDIPLEQVLNQIKNHVDYNSRVQLIHMLFGVANADKIIHDAELKTIQYIANGLGIISSDFLSIKNMHIRSADSAYKILELESNATDDEIKKAYRRMAVKFHPDKVAHLGNEFQESAKYKFQKVTEAYEQIKQERGIK